MRRPRPPLPDPTDPTWRGWVVGLSPDRMHREVCAFLRARAALVHEAITQWTLAGFPGWPDDQPEMPLTLRLRLAERLTVTSPFVRLGIRRIPLLPPGRLTDPPAAPSAPRFPRPGEGAGQELIAQFARALIRTWWIPPNVDAALLAQYEHLRRIFSGLRSRGPSLWQALGIGETAPREITIEPRRYHVPQRKLRRANPNPEPSVLAILFLAEDQDTNTRYLATRLTRARTDRRIHQAWQQYAEWLHRQPCARAKFDALLPTVTRSQAPLPTAWAAR